jgi:ribosomal protein S18 acetylase RimI-like enzyme
MSHPGYQVRPAVPEDASALAAMGERTFRDTFSADNSPDDIAAHVAATYSPAKQASEIADPRRSTLVAATDVGELIGFAQLLAGEIPRSVTGPAPIELLRLYVDRGYHGRGVAQALMAAALKEAADRGALTIWLGVWERNPRAIAFYRKWGFEDVGSHDFFLGRDRQTDRVMVRPVAGGARPRAV